MTGIGLEGPTDRNQNRREIERPLFHDLPLVSLIELQREACITDTCKERSAINSLARALKGRSKLKSDDAASFRGRWRLRSVSEPQAIRSLTITIRGLMSLLYKAEHRMINLSPEA